MRISTTTIESFRLWRDGDWMPESDLIESILGKWKPNHKAELGTAFGKVLEDPDRYMVPGGFACGAFTFGLDVMEPCLALIDRRGVFEAKALKSYGPCDVVSKADHILGAHLSEFKATLGSFDVQRYLDSCQWRFMGDAFRPSRITYRVFCLDECEANGVIGLKDIHSFNVYPYPAMHDDCASLVRDFAEYVTTRDLVGVLQQRQREAA